MDYSALTVKEYVKNIKEKKFTAIDAVSWFADRCKKDHRNAILEVFSDWKGYAEAVDKKIANGTKVGALAGVPIVIKDNVLFKGHIASAGSKMLEKFISPYNATIINKLLAEDAVIIGRANCDEFAMGTTCENSAYGPCLNALSDKHVAGGSSGGSAVAVAAGLCLAAIGTDTGGSVRCPASFNGVVGIKPTYGAVSRFGIIAYASSLEQAGPIAKTVDDVQLLLSVMTGKDKNDVTTIDTSSVFAGAVEKFEISKLRIGRIKEVWEMAKNIEMINQYNKIFDFFKNAGAKIVDISIKNFDKTLPAYYVIATSEATSNLARFDGVKYTSAEQSSNLDELYKETRSKYFGAEVKRRIMLGNYVLNSGFYDEYYNKAVKIRKNITKNLTEAFQSVDCMFMPTTYGTALELGKSVTDPVQLYLEDIFTVPANITGVPAISLPCGTAKNGLPIGLEIFCDKLNEKTLFAVSDYFEKNFSKAGTK